MTARWRRVRAAHVVEHRDRLLLVGEDGSVRAVAGASAALVAEVLAALTSGATAAELAERSRCRPR
jgi:hypothetical protein